MTREEHKKAVEKLLGMVSAEHHADASELLTTLSEDYETTLATSEQATSRVSELTARNEKLRAVNTDLFLKVGTTSKGNEDKGKEGDGKSDTDIPDLTFDKLFNEKGELI